MSSLKTGQIVRYQIPKRDRPNSLGRIVGWTARGLAIVRPIKGQHRNETQHIDPSKLRVWKKLNTQDHHAIH